MKNYIKIKRFSLFSYYYMYVDTTGYLADRLFIKHKVPVKFMKEYSKEDAKYAFIFCKITKKDNDNFLKALKELPDTMKLMGNTDYDTFCEYLDGFERR